MSRGVSKSFPLLTKYFYVSEDGRRAVGVHVWASRADADRLYNQFLIFEKTP